MPYRKFGIVHIGLIKLKPGIDAEATQAKLAASLPDDVAVLTKQGLLDREMTYWGAVSRSALYFGFRW